VSHRYASRQDTAENKLEGVMQQYASEDSNTTGWTGWPAARCPGWGCNEDFAFAIISPPGET